MDEADILQAKLILSDESRPIADSSIRKIFPYFYEYFLKYLPCVQKEKWFVYYHCQGHVNTKKV